MRLVAITPVWDDQKKVTYQPGQKFSIDAVRGQSAIEIKAAELDTDPSVIDVDSEAVEPDALAPVEAEPAL